LLALATIVQKNAYMRDILFTRRKIEATPVDVCSARQQARRKQRKRTIPKDDPLSNHVVFQKAVSVESKIRYADRAAPPKGDKADAHQNVDR